MGEAVRLVGPDEGFQPTRLLVISEIDGIEVQPSAPCDFWQRLGDRRCPVAPAVENWRAGAKAAPAVLVSITIWQQTQAGGGPDLQQRQRAGQTSQHGQQNGTSRRLVRLRAACQRNRAHLVGRSGDKAHGGEQEVRLLFRRR
jgi:hypothetical protein